MADESKTQQAAAFHGLATNATLPLSERLTLAWQALDLYEAGTEELRAEVAALRQQLDEARARHEREMLEQIDECDEAQRVADRLADAIAHLTGADIGEHSSMNDPWLNALDAIGAAEADRDRLLVVYRAAEAWAGTLFGADLETIADDEDHYSPVELRLTAAVKAHRAGAPVEAPPQKCYEEITRPDGVLVGVERPCVHSGTEHDVHQKPDGTLWQLTDDGEVQVYQDSGANVVVPHGTWTTVEQPRAKTLLSLPVEAPDGERA